MILEVNQLLWMLVELVIHFHEDVIRAYDVILMVNFQHIFSEHLPFQFPFSLYKQFQGDPSFPETV